MNTLMRYLLKRTTCNLQEAQAHQRRTYYCPREVRVILMLGLSLLVLLLISLYEIQYNALLNMSA